MGSPKKVEVCFRHSFTYQISILPVHLSVAGLAFTGSCFFLLLRLFSHVC